MAKTKLMKQLICVYTAFKGSYKLSAALCVQTVVCGIMEAIAVSMLPGRHEEKEIRRDIE